MQQSKTVFSLTVKSTQERMCSLLCMCGNDLYFQQQTTQRQGSDTNNTTTCCLQGPHRKRDTSVHAFYFHWLGFYSTSLSNQQNCWILVPKIIASSFSFMFQGRIFWKDTLPHRHIQSLIACTGIYGWMIG